MKRTMKNYDVLIVGAGAAGLAAACRLSRCEKLKIGVLEASERAGRKLAASGNGQGNLSNLDLDISHYHGGNLPLVQKIACNDPYGGLDILDCLFVSDGRGRIYPSGRQASALSEALYVTAEKQGAEILFNKRAAAVSRGFTVLCADGSRYSADCVVLCTGGKAQKQYCTDGSAYSLAVGLGHTLTPLFPSLVQLKTDKTHIKGLKGVRADCAVSAVVDGRTVKRAEGDVIFTDYGVSGNAVFGVSPAFASQTGVLSIEFLPGISADKIAATLERRAASGFFGENILAGIVHSAIARAVLRRAGSSPSAVAECLKNYTLEVTGTLGFDSAQVTRGGINAGEVSEKLESKLVKNLYFAGEILDVDGDCGGYNLHWAFESARTVAEDILAKYGGKV